MVIENKFKGAAFALCAGFLGSSRHCAILRQGRDTCPAMSLRGLVCSSFRNRHFAALLGRKRHSYTGRIDEFGVALGEIAAGHLVWGVIAAAPGLPKGVLAGTYAGIGAEATLGVGLGTNVLVGGTGRDFPFSPSLSRVKLV